MTTKEVCLYTNPFKIYRAGLCSEVTLKVVSNQSWAAAWSVNEIKSNYFEHNANGTHQSIRHIYYYTCIAYNM